MSEDFVGSVEDHPAGRVIDDFHIGQGVVTGTANGEDIQLVVVEFTNQGQMVNAVGLLPELAAQVGNALLSAVSDLQGNTDQQN